MFQLAAWTLHEAPNRSFLLHPAAERVTVTTIRSMIEAPTRLPGQCDHSTAASVPADHQLALLRAAPHAEPSMSYKLRYNGQRRGH